MQRTSFSLLAKELHHTRTWIVVPMTLFLIAAGGSIVAQHPIVLVPIVGAVGMLSLTTMQDRIESLFFVSLGLLLLGYMFQGKGFAYLGFPPLFIGELVLLLGIATVAVAGARIQLSRLELLLVLFMLLGLLRTIPYLGSEGVNAARDAAVWYYGIYAILVSLLLTERHLHKAIQWLGKALPVLVIWLALMPVIVRLLPASLPHFPGSPLPIISVTKPGERAVILVLLGAFVINGLYSRRQGSRPLPAPLFWTCWLTSTLMVAAVNRGGMLAMLLGLFVLMLLRPSKEWFKPIVIGALALTVLLAWNPTIDTGGYRQLSVQQLATNFTSIFSDDTEDLESVQGTKNWRMSWWTDIYQDITDGPDFWTGKGFGLNLATEYGYQYYQDENLRSPHNVHVTILARMGVPGLTLWAALQLAFANQLVRAFRAARRRRDAFWSSVYAWILPIWLAALIKATFDVYLEGPQGAIPFWCLFGLGIAALRLQRLKESTLVAPANMSIGGDYANPARSQPLST